MDSRIPESVMNRLNGVSYYTDEELEQRRLDTQAYFRAYRQQHRVELNKYQLAWYHRNKEVVNARARERYRKKKDALP